MLNAEQLAKLSTAAQIIRNSFGELAFTILEIGAIPVDAAGEPFHDFPVIFPGSKVIAFELDKNKCDQLNSTAKPGIHYFPVALGEKNEDRLLFETVHPMCTSLYYPNTQFLRRFNGMDVNMPKSVSSVHTTSLDEFVQQAGLTPDFIKIDIQGAELDVFRGGVKTLRSVVGIVSEVEFVPLYINQPLFGEVSSFLSEQKFMFHRFLGLAGRTLSPFVLNNDPCFATQHLWADAMFIRDLDTLDGIPDVMLLKMAVLALLYGSKDVSCYCLLKFDGRNGTKLYSDFIDIVK